MATLVFSTIGRLLGGGVGQAVGALIGQRVDQKLLGPKGRQGPRLNDLSVQGSAYGAPIPKLFGINRVAGTVIWATDLREDRKKISNGKGQPKSTVYSYSASFAVALSSRRVIRIGRIWADGNLLRGAAGDFKTQTDFRLHDGREDQPVDPLIAAAEGIASTPAYRGLAYVVFENMQLGDFGNRIPALSFEVIADEGDVPVGGILGELGAAQLAATVPATVAGFAAYGDCVRSVAETLASAFPFSACDDGMVLHLADGAGSAADVAARDLGASAGAAPVPQLAVERRSASTIPEVLGIAHYEIARDYQQGLQRARRDGAARREQRIDLAVVLDAASAKALAEARLGRLWHERVEARIRLPWRRLDLQPGETLAIAGSHERWRVAGVTLAHMVIDAHLVRTGATDAAAVAAEPGRSLAQPDQVHGPTLFHLIDLPAMDDAAATAPRLVVAASGPSSGWRRAALLLSTNGGSSWEAAGVTALPATIGTAATILAPGSALLQDRTALVEISLLNANMVLGDADDMAIGAGRNLAMLGQELIQFRSAVPLGDNRYRLSGLNRGLFGTEWAIDVHAAGDRFILIEEETLASVSVSPGVAEVRVMAAGIGDGTDPPQQSVTAPGIALVPPAPVHLAAVRLANGDTRISWVRRSRTGWRWIDGANAPLGEEREAYALHCTAGAGPARVEQVPDPVFVYSAAARAADIAAGAASMTLAVRQIGQFGLSRAACLTFPLI